MMQLIFFLNMRCNFNDNLYYNHYFFQELQKEAQALKSSRSAAVPVPKVEAFKPDQFSAPRPASFGSTGLEVRVS